MCGLFAKYDLSHLSCFLASHCRGSFTNESPEPKLVPAIAPMAGILAKGEAFVKLRPPLDMLDTMFGLDGSEGWRDDIRE